MENINGKTDPQDIAEIERIETLQKTGLLDREEYEYFYNDCMK